MSIVFMPCLARAKRRVGQVMNSRLVMAAAAETQLCAWLSVSTFGSLIAYAALGWTWLDPVAGFVIAALAVMEGKEAWEGELACADDCDDCAAVRKLLDMSVRRRPCVPRVCRPAATTLNGGSRMPRRHSPALVAVLAALTMSACSSASPSANSDIPSGDPGVAHVHGLGIDPADGVLYAATHYGLFRLPSTGRASRVADRFQDTMGFTVVGPKTFLGSGHPDVKKDPNLPPRLGLIRSTDAALTWTSVSLSGEVDFHALQSAHGNVYGWDSGSGRLMVSADGGATWDTRSTLQLADFVVSPQDQRVLLAATERGLVRSADGGRTFTPVAAPPLVVLAWNRSDRLVGLDGTGQLYASTDASASWTRRGSLDGPPEALAAAGPDLYAAVSGKGVFASSDGGTTWRLRYSDTGAA